jgi:hypothetical protein
MIVIFKLNDKSVKASIVYKIPRKLFPFVYDRLAEYLNAITGGCIDDDESFEVPHAMKLLQGTVSLFFP